MYLDPQHWAEVVKLVGDDGVVDDDQGGVLQDPVQPGGPARPRDDPTVQFQGTGSLPAITDMGRCSISGWATLRTVDPH